MSNMLIKSAKILRAAIPTGQFKVSKKTGKSKEVMTFPLIGVKVEVDNVAVVYSFKHNTYSVTYPDKEVLTRSNQPTGEYVKGTKFGGLTRKQFQREFGAAFVKLIDDACLEIGTDE